MADLYVKNLTLFSKNTFTSLRDALKVARSGDVIHLEKAETIGKITQNKETIAKPIPITTNVTLTGSQTLTVEDQCAGFLVENVNVTLKNLTVRLGAKSNLLKLVDHYDHQVTGIELNLDMGLQHDARDWYPPIFTQSKKAHYEFIHTRSDYFYLQGQSVTLKHCRLGNFYGPQSIIQCESIKHQQCTFHNLHLISQSGQGVYSGTYTKTEGPLVITGFSGLQEGLSLKYTASKTYAKSFLDNSYYRPQLVGLTLNQCFGFTLKDYRQKVAGLEWTPLIIQDSEVILSDFTLKPAPLKNQLINSQLRLQNVTDLGQWQEEGQVKRSEASLKREGNSESFKRLQSLIGLENVKNQLEEMMAMAMTNEELRKRNLPVNNGFSLHMVFAGSAGTGKTTVAKLFGEILYEEGILPTANFTIATRKDLVAEYVGQTAIKTHELIEKAKGGILFIDEAYSLRASKTGNDFANEAVDQLVMDAEEYRDELVIILAGYTNEMEDFINNTNPGLKSRFKNWIVFPDYQLEELLAIIRFTAKDQGLILRDTTTLDLSFAKIFNQKGYVDGNARFIRNYVQDLIMAKNLRTSQAMRSGQQLSDQDLLTVENVDILKTEQKYLNASR